MTQPPATTTVTLQAGDTTKNALLQLATILQTADVLPTQMKPNNIILPVAPTPRVPLDTPEPRVLLDALPPRVEKLATKNVPLSQSPIQNSKIKVPSLKQNKPMATNWQRRHLRPTTSRMKRQYGHERYRGRAADYLHAQHIFSPSPAATFFASHIFDSTGRKQTLDNLLNSKDGPTRWTPALSNEWGRLAQGNDAGVEHTDTIDFIFSHEVPTHKKVTYATFACDHRPLKDEKWRIRIVVGGDKLPYDSDSGSPATNMLETKLLFNSVISDAKEGARFCSMDLKDMFLHTPMREPEYMKVPFKYFPEDVRQKYNLYSKVHNGFIYIKIKKGMYGLKQAALLAYEFLSAILTKAGYAPIPATLGLWRHMSKKTIFSLCVDDFGVKYYNKEDLQHLKQAIETQYTCKVDITGRHFLGFTLDWQYELGYVDLSMPDYIRHALEKLQYKKKVYPQYSPHPHVDVNWTKKGERPYARQEDLTPKLHPKEIKYIQVVVGTFLYYARALDNTMLTALNDIGSQQALPTEKVKQKVQQLLDYANTYNNVFVRFYASDMQLYVDTDAAFLVLPKARSRIAGYFRLLNHQDSGKKFYLDNGPILIECKTLRSVVTSAAESETYGVFHNAKKTLPIIYMLTQMGHPQKHPVPLRTDNSTSSGFVNKNIQMRQSKTWDMHLHWLRDKELTEYIKVFYDKGKNNGADYHTKHHPTVHHRRVRLDRKYVRDINTNLKNKIDAVFVKHAKTHMTVRVCLSESC